MSITLPEATPNTTTTVAPGVAFTWGDNADRATLTVRNTSRASMDAYIDLLTRAVFDWPFGKQVQLLQDINDPNLQLTPFAREAFQRAFAVPLKSPRTGRIAVVVHAVGGRGLLTIAQNSFTQQRMIAQRVFTRLQDADIWLKTPPAEE
jgi:hypothetical protein